MVCKVTEYQVQEMTGIFPTVDQPQTRADRIARKSTVPADPRPIFADEDWKQCRLVLFFIYYLLDKSIYLIQLSSKRILDYYQLTMGYYQKLGRYVDFSLLCINTMNKNHNLVIYYDNE
jgi:hypothetical protein